MCKVIVEHVNQIDYKVFMNWFNQLDMLQRLQTSKNIVIKINLCAGHLKKPNTGVVSNNVLVEQFVKCLREVTTVPIYIAESDSIGNSKAYEKYNFQGYRNLEKYGVSFLDLTRSEMVDCVLPNALYFKQGCLLSKQLVQADFLISFAKVKTHNVTIMSGGIKNLFGCLPAPDKSRYHPYLKHVLPDLYHILKPQMTILETIPAMEGDGPVRGLTKIMDVILVSDDALSADLIACNMMGIDWKRVSYLKRLGMEFQANTQIIGELPQTRFRFIPRSQTMFINTGLLIQHIGNLIVALGHTIHTFKGLRDFLLRVLRKVCRQLCLRGS